MVASVSTLGVSRSRAVRARTIRELKPLPWPPPDLGPARARRPHAHRCTACAAVFSCPGPDDTGLCAPVCSPCYWVELSRQLRIYKAVVLALGRKRRRIGKAACLRAQALRRKLDHQRFLALRTKGLELNYGESGRVRPLETLSFGQAGDCG
jgi:hypothetical protein